MKFSRHKRRDIYFHEDDYCQQEFLPAEATETAKNELENIADFSKKHQTEHGWTDMYIRNAPGVRFDAIGMSRDQLDRLLLDFFPKFDSVYTGYSTHRELCPRTGAWGVSESCCYYANWNEDEIIENVWTSFFEHDGEAVQSMAESAAALATFAPMVYVDWAWDFCVDPSDKEAFMLQLQRKYDGID